MWFPPGTPLRTEASALPGHLRAFGRRLVIVSQYQSVAVAEPLGSRFAKLWTASTTSALGSGLATIAAPLFVAAHTKNPLIVAATTGVAWLPWLLFALPGGVLVDRVDRRRLMVTIDWIRVAVMGVLATAMLAGSSSIALLDVALFLINTGKIVFRSASQAMIPAVVPRARLERAVGYGTLFTCMAAGALLGSAAGDWLIRRVTATWTIRIGLLVEAGLHLVLATSRSAYLVGFMLFAFGVHGALWTIVGSSLRQRLTPPEMMGRVASTGLFIAAGGNCVGAVLGGVIAARFGITAPYWAGFVVAVLVSASTWRVFDRAAVAEAYAEPALSGTAQPEYGRRPATGLRCEYRWEAPVRPEPGAQAAAARLRASRADRERVIDLLKAAFVQGRLARDEFDTRVGQALASRTYAELAAVTATSPPR